MTISVFTAIPIIRNNIVDIQLDAAFDSQESLIKLSVPGLFIENTSLSNLPSPILYYVNDTTFYVPENTIYTTDNRIKLDLVNSLQVAYAECSTTGINTPSNLSQGNNTTQTVIELIWDCNSIVSGGYSYLYYIDSQETPQELTTWGFPEASPYILSTLPDVKANTSYRIVAINSDGAASWSEYSTEKTVWTRPSIPVIAGVVQTGATVKIDWTSTDGAKFQIFKSKDSNNGPWTYYADDITDFTYEDTGAFVSGSTYYYIVNGYSSDSTLWSIHDTTDYVSTDSIVYAAETVSTKRKFVVTFINDEI